MRLLRCARSDRLIDVAAQVFSRYVDNGVVANEVKQSHRFSLIDEMASALSRQDGFYSKKGKPLRFIDGGALDGYE